MKRWTLRILVLLILGAAALLALTAMIIGSLFGYHCGLIDIDMYRDLGGIELTPRLPWRAAALGWLVLLPMTLLAALPAAQPSPGVYCRLDRAFTQGRRWRCS